MYVVNHPACPVTLAVAAVLPAITGQHDSNTLVPAISPFVGTPHVPELRIANDRQTPLNSDTCLVAISPPYKYSATVASPDLPLRLNATARTCSTLNQQLRSEAGLVRPWDFFSNNGYSRTLLPP